MLPTKPQLAAIIFLAGLLPFGKLQEHRVKFILKPLKITTTKASPPRLAFIQTLDFGKTKNDKLKTSTEQSMTVNLTEVIAKRQLRPLAFVLQRRQVTLPGVLITRAEIYNQQEPVISRPINRKYDEPVRSAAHQGNQDWPENLTEKEKRWLNQANVSTSDFEVFNEASVDPVGSHLQAQIAAEMKRPAGDVLPGWIISKPSDRATTSSSLPPTPSPEKDSDRKSYTSTSGFNVQGRIGLGLGVYMGNGEHIEVHWIREGVSKVAGLISTENDFRYEIKVPELIGSVSAEMYDSSGRLKAKGTLRLSQNSNSGDITLHPQQTLASQTTNFYQSPTRLFGMVPLKKSKTMGAVKSKVSVDSESEFAADDQGRLFVDGVVPGSTAFGFSRAKGFYPSIHWLTTGAARAFPMVPESTVKALKDIIRSQQNQTSVDAFDGGLMLGQATREGQPISGVRVELTNNPDLKPIYLNALLIPDPTLQETTANGYFVFANLENGYYSVRASKGNFYFGFSNFLAEAESISFAEIQETNRRAPFEVRAFDAFEGTEVSAAVDLQGLSHSFDVEGYALIEHPMTDQIELAQVQPKLNDYVPSLYVMKGEDDYLHLPVVRRAWFEQMAATQQLSPQPGMGTVIGFVSRGNYQVMLPHLPAETPVNVVFFDSQGNRVEQPVENGGFIAFNVPASAHTIVIRDNFGETASQIIPVDSDRVTTVRFLL